MTRAKTIAAAPVVAPPLPIAPVCARMCARCPFRPDEGGFDFEPGELAGIKASVITGRPFWCHETVLKDPRTTFDKNRIPTPLRQPHFVLCRGGHELHMSTWRLRVIAGGGIPGEREVITVDVTRTP